MLLLVCLSTKWLRRLHLSLPAAAGLALLLCLANDLLDNLFAPVGILLTPVVLATVASLLTATRHPTHVLAIAASITSLACLHDAGIKLYGGGVHDAEGLGFINAFFLAGLLVAYILLIKFLLRAYSVPLAQRLGAGLLLPLLAGSYLYFFGDLGLGRFYESHLIF